MSLVKGVIMEVKQTTAYVLTDQGDFVTCDIGHTKLEIGSEIQMRVSAQPIFEAEPVVLESDYVRMQRLLAQQKMKKRLPKVAQLAAVAALFAVALGGSWTYSWQQVFLEVNPSLEVSYNVYHRVIGVEGRNVEGEKIASALTVYGSKVDEAIVSSLDVMNQQGYLKQNAGVIIGFNEKGEGQKLQKAVANSLVAEKRNVSVVSIQVEKETALEAREMKTTPIHLEIIKKSMTVQEREVYKQDKTVVKEQVKVLENKTTLEIIQDSAPVFDALPEESNKKTPQENISVPTMTPDQSTELNQEPTDVLESSKLETVANESASFEKEALRPLTPQENDQTIEKSTPRVEATAPTKTTKPTQPTITTPTKSSTTVKKPEGTPDEVKIVLDSEGNTTKPAEVTPTPPMTDFSVAVETEEKIVLDDVQKGLPTDLQKKIKLLQTELKTLKTVPDNFKTLPKLEQMKLLRQKINRALVLVDKIEYMKMTNELKKTLKAPFKELISRYEKWLDQIRTRP